MTSTSRTAVASWRACSLRALLAPGGAITELKRSFKVRSMMSYLAPSPIARVITSFMISLVPP